MHCEVIVERPNGTRADPVAFDVPDGASNDVIQARAQEALQSASVGRGLANVDLNYFIRIDDDPAHAGMDHMLFIRGGQLVRDNTAATRPGGSSPLTYHVQWARDQILRAKVTNMAQLDTDPNHDGIDTMPGLEGLSYVTDGQAGPLSQDEARSFLRRFEMLFGDDAAGRARLQYVYSQNPEFNFGPDGSFRLNDIYTRANIAPPGSLNRPDLTGGASDPSVIQPGSPGDVASQIANNVLDMSYLDANDRRIMAEIRRLQSMLMMGCDPEILMPMLTSLFVQLAKSGQARSGLQISQVLERVQNQINQNAQRIGQLQGNQGASGRTPQQAGSDQGEITRLSTANQILTSSLQSMRPLLESFQSETQEVASLNQAVREFRQRRAQQT